MWGYPDSTNVNKAGATRLINTSWASPSLSLTYPEDRGSICNILSGETTVQGVSPFSSMYNAAGTLVITPTGGGGPTVFENNVTIVNQAGAAVPGMTSLQTLVGTTTYLANAAACAISAQTDVGVSPAFEGTNGGTMACTTVVNYSGGATILSNATVTTMSQFKVVQPTVSGTLTNSYGVDIPLLTTASTTNTPIAIGRGPTTLTAALTGSLIDLLPGTTTLNFSNARLSTLVGCGGTIVCQQSAFVLGLMTMFNADPVVKNISSVAANLAGVIGYGNSVNVQADTQSITAGAHQSFFASPTWNVINAGTITGGSLYNYSSTATVSTGVTMTNLIHFSVLVPTITGTITTQIGLNIPALTGATTNTGIQNLSSLAQQGAFIATNNAVTVTSNAGTVASTAYLSTFTNSSAATMAITMSTTGAVDGQKAIVRIYDFSAATETIGWTNTENSQASVPTTSNGSTTLPLTVGFIFNGQTSKWRCVAVT
jgi:hypothetical protein